MNPNYKILSLVYDLLDVIYFNHPKTSPRTAMLNAVPGNAKTVLDICAGTCSNSILIARNRPTATITAVDLSAEMLKIAEKKFRKKGVGNIETKTVDACNTGLPDCSFDVILLSLVLHEISEDLCVSILTETKRMLKPSGRILVIEWEQPETAFGRILFAPIKTLEPKGFREFLQRDLSVYFVNFGLNVLEYRKCDYTGVYTLTKT